MKYLVTIFVVLMTVYTYGDTRNGMSTFDSLSEVTVASSILGTLPEVKDLIDSQQKRGFSFYGVLAAGIQEFKDSRNFILVFKRYDYTIAPGKDGLYKPEVVMKLIKVEEFSSRNRQAKIYDYSNSAAL